MTTKLPDGVTEGTLRDFYYNCNDVSPFCPVQATTLGYFPNKGINYFFAIAFGLAGATALALGVWKKTWSYTAFVTAGCALELAGEFLLVFLDLFVTLGCPFLSTQSSPSSWLLGVQFQALVVVIFEAGRAIGR